MKLPVIVNTLLNNLKKENKPLEIFLSLIVDQDHIAGACWYIGEKKNIKLLHAVARSINKDTWEEKIKASDEVISSLEQKLSNRNIHKVIFGLPAAFLTIDGEIKKDIRTHLKKLTTELDLKAIGFVPIHQAIVYKFKKDEGVPPSMILVGVYKSDISIALYKVGKLSEVVTIPNSSGYVENIEKVLKSFKNIEVLPSRILIYGINKSGLENFKAEMTHHPWSTRVNFIHFPKIAILPSDMAIVSVSSAGASELMMALPEIADSKSESGAEAPVDSGKKEFDQLPNDNNSSKESGELDHNISLEDKEPDEDAEKKDTDNEIDTKKENDSHLPEDEPNIQIVSPEEVGFKAHTDVYETHQVTRKQEVPTESKVKQVHDTSQKEEIKKVEEAKSKKAILPLKPLEGSFKRVLSFVKNIFSGKGKLYPIAAFFALFAILVGWWILVVVIPRATVEVKIVQKQVHATASATIDQEAKSVDSDRNVIPATKLEKTVSGEKSIKVSGKKEVGDPAKGTIIIYNKSLVAKTFKKGTILSNGSVDFSLDSDVKIASASESIGSITFGKEEALVTAKKIGSQGNLPANSDFIIEDISTSIAEAQNDEAFSGGTSREVTVVTRSDYDELIELITPELVKKAKDELEVDVTQGQKLIDETIETTVSEKVFTQELDEEASQLDGVITITVSGLSYKLDDLKIILEESIKSSLPEGYELDLDSINISNGEPDIVNNQVILPNVTIKGYSVPSINLSDIKKDILGKDDSMAIKFLKEIPGVESVNIKHQYSVFGNKLPSKIENISVQVSEK
ncbi:hypothetical protein ACFL1A_02455 [Patescibacteria group bacterium]